MSLDGKGAKASRRRVWWGCSAKIAEVKLMHMEDQPGLTEQCSKYHIQS